MIEHVKWQCQNKQIAQVWPSKALQTTPSGRAAGLARPTIAINYGKPERSQPSGPETASESVLR
jgi:hypothetical protein